MIRINPSHIFENALSAAKAKHYTSALEYIDLHLEMEPSLIKAHCLKASILIGLHRIDEAKRVCLDILKKNQWNSEGSLLLGLIAKIEGNNGEAIRQFKHSIYVRPSLWLAHFNLGEIYTAQNEVERAIREYDITINLLEKRGSIDSGITYFPLAFSEEHLIHLCKHNRDKLTQ